MKNKAESYGKKKNRNGTTGNKSRRKQLGRIIQMLSSKQPSSVSEYNKEDTARINTSRRNVIKEDLN